MRRSQLVKHTASPIRGPQLPLVQPPLSIESSHLITPKTITMEGRGLTLRSKSRRQRPQISAPKPISGPLPPNTRAPDAGQGALPTGKDRAPQNDATADLVKRRYSSRFNAPGDFETNVPPVPSLPPQIPGGGFGGLPVTTPAEQPSPADGGPSSAPKVDLNVLRDPSLPVERCACFSFPDPCLTIHGTSHY